MGQAYSYHTASEDERQQQSSESQRDQSLSTMRERRMPSTTSTGPIRAVRVPSGQSQISSSLRGGRSVQERLRRNNPEQSPRRFRFSPYNLFASRSNSPSANSQAIASGSRDTRSADTSSLGDADGAIESERMSLDSIPPQTALDTAAELGTAIGGNSGSEEHGDHLEQTNEVLAAEDTERDQDEDVIMTDAGVEVDALPSGGEETADLQQRARRRRRRRSWRGSHTGRHTGNELLSRIVGRSVINSVAQELERRNTTTSGTDHTQNSEESLDSELRSSEDTQEEGDAVSASDSSSSLDGDDGLEAPDSHVEQQPQSEEEQRPLNYVLSAVGRVELYFRISSFIQSILESDHDSQGSAEANTTDAQSGEADNIGSMNTEQQPQSTQEAAASTESTSEPSEDQSAAAAAAARNLVAGTEFRLFLLPGAIDQALETYEREHGGSSATQENASEDTAPSVDAAASSSASSQDNSDISGEPSDRSERAREYTAGERRRERQQRSREEKLQCLRNIARAMNDERRNIQFPVMMVGIRLSPELRQQTRAALGTLSDTTRGNDSGPASNSNSSSSTSLIVEPARDAPDMQTLPAAASAAPTPAPNNNGNEHSRGFIGRVGEMLPSISDIVTSLRRIHNATTPRGFGRTRSNSDIVGAQPSATAVPLVGNEGDNSDGANQPGMAVFIMIHYMNLSNPMVLPMVTHSLFPELISDAPGLSTTSLHPQASNGNSYDLFLEIADIIGQVTTTTVSQDIIDKHLRQYRYEGRVADSGEDGAAVARLIVEEDDDEPEDGAQKHAREIVRLVSADQCPVCLECFEIGDVLRVLTCNHGLHKACGDSWFTQGSNKCPICRSQAVHSNSAEQRLSSL